MTDDEAALNMAHKGQYYVLSPSFRGGGRFHGLEIANEERLLEPARYTMNPPNGDPGQYPQRPHLVHRPKEGRMPRDFESLAGIWIISEALKSVFETVDPDGFAFTACDFTLADGTPGPPYHLCDVIREVDAIDEGRSRLKIRYERCHITGEDVKLYSLAGGASLAFRPDIVGDAHIFRQPRLPADPICDRAMADALTAARLDGVRLRDAADF